MNIVIVSQVFLPERSAASNRMKRFVLALKNKNNVKVICQVPNYPTGIIEKKYKYRCLVEESYDGCDVLRTWVVPSDNSEKFKRSLNYITFFFSSLFFGLFRLKKVNLVIGSSPQLLNALSGVLIAKVKGARFIFDVRDIWPESIKALGLMKEGIIFSLLERIEKWLYKNSDEIVTINEGLKTIIADKIGSDSKISVIQNVVENFEAKNPADLQVDNLNKPKDWFLALYAGNHSKAQNMKTILLGVLESQKNKEPIYYLFIGHGEEKKMMKGFAERHSLKNIQFLDPVDMNELRKYYSQADVCIAALHQDPLFYYALPTKVLEYMAMSKPVIFIGDNYFAKKIETLTAGFNLLESESTQLGKKIMSICDDQFKKNRMGKAGLLYVKQHHSREVFRDKLLRLIDTKRNA